MEIGTNLMMAIIFGAYFISLAVVAWIMKR